MTEYSLVSYKQVIDSEKGIMKKFGVLCSEHKEICQKDLPQMVIGNFKELDKITILTLKQ